MKIGELIEELSRFDPEGLAKVRSLDGYKVVSEVAVTADWFEESKLVATGVVIV